MKRLFFLGFGLLGVGLYSPANGQTSVSAQTPFWFQGHPALSGDQLDNWGTVVSGQIYRSKKLDRYRFEERARKMQIKSVLCLDKCSDQEKATSDRLGIQYFDQKVNIPELTLKHAERIVQILKTAPKPLLIHCKAGADRTGMAAALYKYEIEGASMSEAIKDSLRLRYGHLGKWNTPKIYEVLEAYAKKYPH